MLIPGKEYARRIPLRDVKVCLKGGGGDEANPAQPGKTARLKGSLEVGIWPNHFCSLSLIVYTIGSEQVNDLLGGNKTLPPL